MEARICPGSITTVRVCYIPQSITITPLHIRWRTRDGRPLSPLPRRLEYDIRQQTWAELNSPTRLPVHIDTWSGHSAAVGSTMLVLVVLRGGRDTPRWYFDGRMWICKRSGSTAHSKLTARPEPRSTRRYYGDDMMCTGDFKCPKTNSSTEKPTRIVETRVHSDSWVLHLSPILQGKSPTWERWYRPCSASSFAEQDSEWCSEWRPSRIRIDYSSRRVSWMWSIITKWTACST
jgi:hypothetical protein